MTTITGTNGLEIEVFVHEILDICGEAWAIVNKGDARTNMTFRVRTSAIHGLVVA